jgi:anaerobic magnesium-protoporphyrin IX monomethyl ester cyclase
MYDLLLINPSLNDVRERSETFSFAYVDSGHGYIPLFAVTLIPYVRRAGFSVKFLDMELYSNRDERRLLEIYAPSARFIGLSVMTAQIPQALHATRAAREIAPKAEIVWGGIHGTLLPEQTAAHPLIDHVVVGEGEEPLVALLAGKKHSRLCNKHNPPDMATGATFLPMEDLPDPDYDAVEMDRYFMFQRGHRNCDVMTSRGCPYKCSFCVNTIITNRWRGLSPERSIGILRRLSENHAVQHVLFADENFLGRVSRATAIVKGLVELGITWEANICVTDFLALDDSFVRLMLQSGLTKLRMGVESASDRLLAILNKNITRNDIVAARERCLAFGIKPCLSFMTKLPDELPEEAAETRKLAQESEQRGAEVLGPLPFRPYPGSAEYEKLIHRGLKIPASLEEWRSSDLFEVGIRDRTLKEEIRRMLRRVLPRGTRRVRVARAARNAVSGFWHRG